MNPDLFLKLAVCGIIAIALFALCIPPFLTVSVAKRKSADGTMTVRKARWIGILIAVCIVPFSEFCLEMSRFPGWFPFMILPGLAFGILLRRIHAPTAKAFAAIGMLSFEIIGLAVVFLGSLASSMGDSHGHFAADCGIMQLFGLAFFVPAILITSRKPKKSDTAP